MLSVVAEADLKDRVLRELARRPLLAELHLQVQCYMQYLVKEPVDLRTSIMLDALNMVEGAAAVAATMVPPDLTAVLQCLGVEAEV
jgi:hypothetical protein